MCTCRSQYCTRILGKTEVLESVEDILHVALLHGSLPELVVLLGGRVGQVLEDYDGVRCQQFYSDSSCVTTVARSDTVRVTVRERPGTCIW